MDEIDDEWMDEWMIKSIASSDNIALFMASLLLVRCGHTSSRYGSEL